MCKSGGVCVCVCVVESVIRVGECDAKVWLKRATLHCIKYILPLTYTHSLTRKLVRSFRFVRLIASRRERGIMVSW